jgi:hypothetical protein
VEGVLYVWRGLGPSGAARYGRGGVSDDNRRAPAQAGAGGESREAKGQGGQGRTGRAWPQLMLRPCVHHCLDLAREAMQGELAQVGARARRKF